MPASVSRRDKAAFAASPKLIWQAGDKKAAREQVESLRSRYEKQYPKAIEVLDKGPENSLSYYDFPSLDARKISIIYSIINREMYINIKG